MANARKAILEKRWSPFRDDMLMRFVKSPEVKAEINP
jgi:hypothetical protein